MAKKDRIEKALSASAGGAVENCDRCGGRFPGPGLALNGRVYCCDKCATGPRLMMILMTAIPVAGLVVGVILGRLTVRNASFRQR